jgi:hypothetical protein
VVMQKTGLPYQKALSRLRHAHGLLRDAIGEDIEPHLRELIGEPRSVHHGDTHKSSH